MFDIASNYGPRGRSGGCDEHVADLLMRTVEGQPQAVATFDRRLSGLLAESTLVSGNTQVMTAVHSEWLAMLHWQLATLYLDATVVQDIDAGSFAASVYPQGDALCDVAVSLSRQAAQVRSALAHQGKVRLARVASFPTLSVTPFTYQGVWVVYCWVTDQVVKYAALFEQHDNVAMRLKPLYLELYRRVHSHVEAMSVLRTDFNSTRLAKNAMDIVGLALPHVSELYLLAQYLWAPYLFGPRYAEAMSRQLALNELQIGIDPWVLTDPEAYRQKYRDVASCNELAAFWSTVGDISGTSRLAQQVTELLRKDKLRRRTGRAYRMVPWPSQYMVRHSVMLNDRRFVPGDLIAFFVRTGATGAQVELRKTGHLTNPLDLLGQTPEK